MVENARRNSATAPLLVSELAREIENKIREVVGITSMQVTPE